MAIAQKAIRQALDSGVIPAQLQPKPQRPADTAWLMAGKNHRQGNDWPGC